MVDKVVYDKSLRPTERKPKPKNLKTDEMGFSYTPNGSFYDMDDEYFNKAGFDIHGGWYTKEKEYIYGPDWLSDLGCYEDEKEKYININPLEDINDDNDCEDENNDLEVNFDNLNVENEEDNYEKLVHQIENISKEKDTKICFTGLADQTQSEKKEEVKAKKRVHRAKKKKN